MSFKTYALSQEREIRTERECCETKEIEWNPGRRNMGKH